MVCWPFFAEQQTNCRYACAKWGVGVEIEGDVRRGKVEKMVRVMMEGEKRKEMRKKASEWKDKARAAAKPGGSSFTNLETLINATLLNNN
ncbi:UNVERIFIED_CONTAM: UDP-glycosyltransferase 85A3 [Sesamum radiatum]|uniref:UDP-glycosyltransferase 85A3 n=1 Tax=Sesamum radiatum TaxID=300843 RepID=A0AAW2RVX5_SESRA